MRSIKQNTSANVMVMMTDADTHINGIAGLTLSVSISKNGGAFSSISRTITDRGFGWYNVALVSGDTNTLGDLVLHVDGGATADPTDLVLSVSAATNDDVYALLQVVDGKIDTLQTSVNSGFIAVDSDLTAIQTDVNAIQSDVTNIGVIVAQSDTLVEEIHQLQGLKLGTPSTTTPTLWSAGAIQIAITGDGETSTTMTRQP
jgi:hypothetical protein